VRLLNLYGEPLVRFLIHVCRVEAVEAEDLAVETLYRAIERVDFFVEKSEKDRHGFQNWLFTIARNLWRDRMRKGQSLTRWDDFEHLRAPSLETERDATSPRIQAVREALMTLPDSQRLTLILHYGGLRLTEVAEILDARPGTVRQWKRRGIAALARALQDHPALAHIADGTVRS
jgi:RNA polymerase sigma factor (sigma-70 family)